VQSLSVIYTLTVQEFKKLLDPVLPTGTQLKNIPKLAPDPNLIKDVKCQSG
jgi:hypothetical protein